jgi:hypothetical protein
MKSHVSMAYGQKATAFPQKAAAWLTEVELVALRPVAPRISGATNWPETSPCRTSHGNPPARAVAINDFRMEVGRAVLSAPGGRQSIPTFCAFRLRRAADSAPYPPSLSGNYFWQRL